MWFHAGFNVMPGMTSDNLLLQAKFVAVAANLPATNTRLIDARLQLIARR